LRVGLPIRSSLAQYGSWGAPFTMLIREASTAFEAQLPERRCSGIHLIPAGWLDKLAMREFITRMADQLSALSEKL
jgi:hypothetical protein